MSKDITTTKDQKAVAAPLAEGEVIADPTVEEAATLSGYRDDIKGLQDDIEGMLKEVGANGLVQQALQSAYISLADAFRRFDNVLTAHEKRLKDIEAREHPEGQTKEKQEAAAR